MPHIKYGFTATDDSVAPNPLCDRCGEILQQGPHILFQNDAS